MTENGPSGPQLRSAFHYTDRRGLDGILGTSYLRASQATELNDPSEIEYGLALIDGWLQERTDTAAIRALRRIASVRPRLDQLFVLSASRLPDDVSQWQRYGDQGRGFVIELDVTQALTIVGAEREAVDTPPSRFAVRARDAVEIRTWAPVLYGPEAGQTALAELEQTANADIEEFTAQIRNLHLSEDDADVGWEALRDGLAVELDALAVRMKHHGYSSEAEVRLVASLVVHHERDVGVIECVGRRRQYAKLTSDPSRQSRGVLRAQPGHELHLRLPILSVGIGPCAEDLNATEDYVGTLLQASGYPEARIWRSDCPVRCPMDG